jgi:hypothetical protein
MNRSFFQSVCVLGYCLFPLTIAALINVFVHTIIVRLPVICVTYVWSSFGMTLVSDGADSSVGVGFAWKSIGRTEVAGYLSTIAVLFRAGIHDTYLELTSIYLIPKYQNPNYKPFKCRIYICLFMISSLYLVLSRSHVH